MNPHASVPARLAILLLGTALAACGESEAPPDDARSGAPAEAPALPSILHERAVAFLAVDGDSVVSGVWEWTSRSSPGTPVRYGLRSWFRGPEGWRSLAREGWEAPPTRSPWRILPSGPIRIGVGDGDELAWIRERTGNTGTLLRTAAVLSDWTGPSGGRIRLLEGSLSLPGGQVEGLILDLSQLDTEATGGADPLLGEWAVLTGPDETILVLEGFPAQGVAEGRGWGRLDQRDLLFPVLRMLWTRPRTFDPARRDIPGSWEISTPEGEASIRLEVRDSWLEAGEGSGAVLPVQGLFRISGVLVLEGRTLPLVGIWRHRQESVP